MAASPEWKIYSVDGTYLAATKRPEEAAVLVAFLGDGSTIRHGHRTSDVAWIEGTDGEACESYDAVAGHCWTWLIRRRDQAAQRRRNRGL